MRIAGQREDGALYVALGGGMAVILKDGCVSPTLDDIVVDGLGPWTSTDNSYPVRKRVALLLDHARVMRRMEYFALVFTPFVKKDDEKPKDDDKPPVSDAAQATETGAVLNLPPTDVAVVTPVVDPVEERKQRRVALLDKVRKAARSKGRTADTLESEEISDDDLFAMAKELGVSVEEVPAVVALVDNATKFQRLLASTKIAKLMKLDDKSEHPFQWCKDHVIPAMEAEGKGPDDPDAFCAWYKNNEGPAA